MNKLLQSLFFFFFLLIIHCSVLQAQQKDLNQVMMQAIESMDKGDFPNSEKFILEALTIDPENKAIISEAALLYYKWGKFEKALEYVEKGGPKMLQFHLLKGSILDQLNKKEEALQVYDEAIRLYPDRANLYREKAVVYMGQKKHREALQVLEQGIDLHPEYPGNYFLAAQILFDYPQSNGDIIAGMNYAEIFLLKSSNTTQTKEIARQLIAAYKGLVRVKKKESDTSTIEVEIVRIKPPVSNYVQKPRSISTPEDTLFSTLSLFIWTDAAKNGGKLSLKQLVEIRSLMQGIITQKSKNMQLNPLYELWSKVEKAGYAEAYNYTVLGYSGHKDAKEWIVNNKAKYEEFNAWLKLNDLQLSAESKYLRTDWK
jgi:tetratricopeptide (TPR) repeat protein